GNVWIGTQNLALHRFHDGKFTTWKNADGLVSHTIHALLAGTNGDVWIGGNAPESLQHFHDGSFETFNVPRGVGMIRALVADRDGTIWAGTTKGSLLRLRGGETVAVGGKLGSTNSIRSLCATPDGTLWIGYAGWGLGRLKDGRVQRITAARGLFDDFISQIVPDGNGWLWFGA